MTFYQELQLNQAGSKSYIKTFERKRDKVKHTAIFIFKILLNVGFSTAFIIAFGLIFGMENCIAGLTVLLCIMSFRFSDFGIKTSHSFVSIFIIFAVFAGGPKLANVVPVGWSFAVNVVCIFILLLFGCRNVKFFNHTILVLSFLLLQGSPVSGFSYIKRLICLGVGAILTALVFYHNHRKSGCKDGLSTLFTDFTLADERSRWQIRFCLCISCAVLVSTLFGAAKPMWAGIAAMSVMSPFKNTVDDRAKFRILGNVFGCLIFLFMTMLLPQNILTYVGGTLGGICLGFSALYGWQTVFNSVSALSAAFSTLGAWNAILFRILNNAFGAICAFAFDKLVEPALLLLNRIPRIKRRGRE